VDAGAFFDLDDTLVSGSAGLRFAKYLYKNKVIRLKGSIIVPIIKAMYNLFRDDAPKYIKDFDELWALLLKGVKKEIIIDYAKKYAGLEVKAIRRELLSRIEHHRSLRDRLILISASPDELVKEIGASLGFNYSIGTRIGVVKGVYNGVVLTPYLSGKDRVLLVLRLVKKYKLNLAKSFAYGNGENDIGVLEIMGHPVAVNPIDELKPLSKKKGWEIIKC
jgi:HAD superfamily hydrolase (TIGR01490 family)